MPFNIINNLENEYTNITINSQDTYPIKLLIDALLTIEFMNAAIKEYKHEPNALQSIDLVSFIYLNKQILGSILERLPRNFSYIHSELAQFCFTETAGRNDKSWFGIDRLAISHTLNLSSLNFDNNEIIKQTKEEINSLKRVLLQTLKQSKVISEQDIEKLGKPTSLTISSSRVLNQHKNYTLILKKLQNNGYIIDDVNINIQNIIHTISILELLLSPDIKDEFLQSIPMQSLSVLAIEVIGNNIKSFRRSCNQEELLLTEKWLDFIEKRNSYAHATKLSEIFNNRHYGIMKSAILMLKEAVRNWLSQKSPGDDIIKLFSEKENELKQNSELTINAVNRPKVVNKKTLGQLSNPKNNQVLDKPETLKQLEEKIFSQFRIELNDDEFAHEYLNWFTKLPLLEKRKYLIGILIEKDYQKLLNICLKDGFDINNILLLKLNPRKKLEVGNYNILNYRKDEYINNVTLKVDFDISINRAYDYPKKYELYPIVYALNTEDTRMLEILIRYGKANCNIKALDTDFGKCYFIHRIISIFRNNEEFTKLFFQILENDINVNVETETGLTTIDCAILTRNKAALEILVKKDEIDLLNETKKRPNSLYFAIKKNGKEIYYIYIRGCLRKGGFHYLAKATTPYIEKCDLDEKPENAELLALTRSIAIISQAKEEEYPLHKAILEGNIDKVENLLIDKSPGEAFNMLATKVTSLKYKFTGYTPLKLAEELGDNRMKDYLEKLMKEVIKDKMAGKDKLSYKKDTIGEYANKIIDQMIAKICSMELRTK